MTTLANMVGIFFVLGFIIYILINAQVKVMPWLTGAGLGRFLPDENNKAKREFEIYALKYTAIWIGIFGIVVITKIYWKITTFFTTFWQPLSV